MSSFDNTIERLKKREEEISSVVEIGGPSLLTYPERIDSARLVMFNSHLNQRVILNETETPKVFTNFENIIGDNSSFNVRAKTDMEIVKIIHKFPKLENSKDTQQAVIFVYDREKECYDLIVRNDVEDLTERYGFEYDNSGINKYKEGDVIEKGETLFRPTSYDEYGNYGFGINVRAMYLVDDDTLEDAIVVSESLAKRMQSTEVEQVKVTINDNDVLVDLYGDDEHYKAFPDIGESTKDKVLCAKRRVVSSQILFDFKKSNTKKTLANDIRFFIDGVVTDVDIYCNKPLEEIPKASFNNQLLSYIEMTDEFYTQIRDYTRELIDSGVPCSQNIRYWNRRATERTDPERQFKDESGSAFSYITMYFTVKRHKGISRGQKITG